MEEESTHEYDHDISSFEHTLFSYLHRLKLGSELFFISAVTKQSQKDDLLTNFPEFLDIFYRQPWEDEGIPRPAESLSAEFPYLKEKDIMKKY